MATFTLPDAPFHFEQSVKQGFPGIGLQSCNAELVQVASTAHDFVQFPEDYLACIRTYVRQQRSKKGNRIEAYPKTDTGVRDIDLAPALVSLLREYIDGRKNGFLFQTSSGLPMSPRNIARDSLHPILKDMGRASAGFHVFRRFRESVLQMSEARTLHINYWMGHADGEMSRRYGRQLVDNVRWRQECVGKVGLGFNLPRAKVKSDDGQVGQVLPISEHHANAA